MMKKINIHFSREEGLLIRLAMVLERRSFRLDQLKLHRFEQGGGSLQLSISGDPARYAQVLKQIQKLIDIVSVQEENEVPSQALALEQVLS